MRRRHPVAPPPGPSAPAEESERSKIIRRLRALVPATFASVKGVLGYITPLGLYGPDAKAMVPYEGQEDSKYPGIKLEHLQEVVRANERCIEPADDRPASPAEVKALRARFLERFRRDEEPRPAPRPLAPRPAPPRRYDPVAFKRFRALIDNKTLPEDEAEQVAVAVGGDRGGMTAWEFLFSRPLAAFEKWNELKDQSKTKGEA